MSRLIEWGNVCLVCLQKGESRFIYDQDNDSSVIADKIMKCADIIIKRDANQPKNICLQCANDLNVAYKFRRNCEQSDSIIKALLNISHKEFEIKHLWETTLIKDSPTHDICTKDEINDNHKEFQIKHLWKTTPITTNITHDVCIKDEIMDKPKVDDTCDSPFPLDLERGLDTAVKFGIKDCVDSSAHGNDMELNNMKLTESNEIKQEANNGMSRQLCGQSKTSTELSSDKPTLKLAYERPMKNCEVCNHSFRGQHALDIHMRRHNNDRPFTCEQCGKSFVATTDLRRHMRVHSGQKPYKCQYCDRRFAEMGNRKNHERRHTGERPFVCPTCGKSFAYSNYLTEHRRIHTGVKKFECKECGKGFLKKALLEKHITHHLTGDELDKSSEPKQKMMVEKEIFKVEECVDSNEINIKHELKFIEEEVN